MLLLALAVLSAKELDDYFPADDGDFDEVQGIDEQETGDSSSLTSTETTSTSSAPDVPPATPLPTEMGNNFTVGMTHADGVYTAEEMEGILSAFTGDSVILRIIEGATLHIRKEGVSFDITGGEDKFTLFIETKPKHLKIHDCFFDIFTEGGAIIPSAFIQDVHVNSTGVAKFSDLEIGVESCTSFKDSVVTNALYLIEKNGVTKFSPPMITNETFVAPYTRHLILAINAIQIAQNMFAFYGTRQSIVIPKYVMPISKGDLNVQLSKVALPDSKPRAREILENETQLESQIPVHVAMNQNYSLHFLGDPVKAKATVHCNGRFYLHVNNTIDLTMNESTSAMISPSDILNIIDFENITVGEFLIPNIYIGKYATFKGEQILVNEILLTNVKLLVLFNQSITIKYVDGAVPKVPIILDNLSQLIIDESFKDCKSKIHVICDGDATFTPNGGVDLKNLINVTTSNGNERNIDDFIKNPADAGLPKWMLYAIIGGIALVVLILIMIIVCCCCCKKDKKKNDSSGLEEIESESHHKHHKSKAPKKSNRRSSHKSSHSTLSMKNVRKHSYESYSSSSSYADSYSSEQPRKSKKSKRHH